MEKEYIRYERIKCIGEGQFAIVYKAKDTTNNKIVAVKKIKYCQKENRNELISEVIASEIKILNSLKHENIIELLDVMEDRFNISLVFDHMESDLEKVIKNTKILIAPENIKAILKMILQGLEYLHSKQIMHRDLKPNNLLINANGIVKIADFGLAKYYGSPKKVHTHQVATRWYRAPELLFGSRHYDTSIDIWSVGCVLAELLLRTPFLPGTSDLDQLTKIFEVFGTPTPDTWPGIERLPHYVNFGNCTPTPIGNVFRTAPPDLLELASRLFTLYPTQRCTATQAMNMPYFTNEPKPVNLNTIPKLSLSAKRGRSVKRRRLDKEMDGGTVPKKLFF